MVTNSLFNLQSAENEVEKALRSSLLDFGDLNGCADLWVKTSLQNKVEGAMKNIVNNSNSFSGSFSSNPPRSGFWISFGLLILIGYKIRYRGTANLGYGNRWSGFGATSSLHCAIYNDGLGTGIHNKHKKDFTVDITASVNLTFGSGNGTPLQSYSLNYNSPIPMLNDF